MARSCFDDTKVVLDTFHFHNFNSFIYSSFFFSFFVDIYSFLLLMTLLLMFQGAVLIKNLAAKEPSALGLDTYYKQYYLCLAAAAATIKWYFQT